VSTIPRSLRQALHAEQPEPYCAYCHSPEKLLGMSLEIDHIVPRVAGGSTELSNLCLCCRSCNGYKWQHTHARDPLTGRRVRLFHPRRQHWTTHLTWSADGTLLIGQTATGRATVMLLRMNNELIMELSSRTKVFSHVQCVTGLWQASWPATPGGKTYVQVLTTALDGSRHASASSDVTKNALVLRTAMPAPTWHRVSPKSGHIRLIHATV
jgi:hypothetical protein